MTAATATNPPIARPFDAPDGFAAAAIGVALPFGAMAATWG
jgi:hypothetical protein